LPKTIDPFLAANPDRAYQVEVMRLKDELMQVRVENFDLTQKFQLL